MDEETKEAMASGRPVNIWHIGSVGQMNPNATTVTNNYYGDQFAPQKESNDEEESDDEPPAEEWKKLSVGEKVKRAIQKMQKERLMKGYDYTWLMLIMNEAEDSNSQYHSLGLPSFKSSQSFKDYLEKTLELKNIPSLSTIGERQYKTSGRFPWNFEDTSDVNETNRRNNIVNRFIAIYTKG
jgi:hypothetical protein